MSNITSNSLSFTVIQVRSLMRCSFTVD
jgi:hypothetical protein